MSLNLSLLFDDFNSSSIVFHSLTQFFFPISKLYLDQHKSIELFDYQVIFFFALLRICSKADFRSVDCASSSHRSIRSGLVQRMHVQIKVT